MKRAIPLRKLYVPCIDILLARCKSSDLSSVSDFFVPKCFFKFNEIINGGVDWVYEEEFSMSQGFEWSPSGRYIAYYKFDESEVTEFSMDEFYDLYPNQVRWKYPKAGEDNSRVDVYVYDLRSKPKTQLPLQSESDQYIPRGQW